MSCLVLIIGVRPQYIKARDFLWHMQRLSSFRNYPTSCDVRILDTAQHYSKELLIDAPLDVFARREHTSCEQTSIFSESIDWCMRTLERFGSERLTVGVFGDANPAAVGAMAASQLGIPVIHIEAGARRDPAEIEHRNSRLVDAIAVRHYCVSRAHQANLIYEGVRNSVVIGDLGGIRIREWVANGTVPMQSNESRHGIVISLHRPGNMLAAVFEKYVSAAISISDEVTLVVHPRAEKIANYIAERYRVRILPALPQLDMLKIISTSLCLVTDSGGLIREAHYVETPVLVVRRIGGWEELIDAGINARAIDDDCTLHYQLQSLIVNSRSRNRHSGSPLIDDEFDSKFIDMLSFVADQ
jgi:UDP-N-acetylglucosamine 2-epimerase